MVDYAGTVRTAKASGDGIGLRVKGAILCGAVGILCWVTFAPLLVLSGIALKSIMAWSGLQAS